MLRSSQHLCRQALARPISRSLLRDTTPWSCLRATITPQARLCLSRATVSNPRPRHFAISHALLAQAQTPKPLPQEQPAPTTPIEEVIEIHIDSLPRRRRRRRGLYYAALFLFLGVVAGTGFRLIIAPPRLPPPGSDKNIYLQEQIQARGLALPLVKQLSSDPAWTSWDAYAGISTTTPAPTTPSAGERVISAARSRITSGPMSGVSGLAFQRIFHNAATGEVVSVVYFGPGLAGWPGVAHGGALATVLDESLGRCAILRFPSRTGVTANLELQYRAPTYVNDFYVVRAAPVAGDDDDLVGRDGVRKGDRKLWVRGSLETVGGEVTVEAKALFVVPRAYKLKPLVEGF